jgi:hypothetical protein
MDSSDVHISRHKHVHYVLLSTPCTNLHHCFNLYTTSYMPSYGTMTLRHTGLNQHYMIYHQIDPYFYVTQIQKLPDDGRLLPKHVGGIIKIKAVVQICARCWLFLLRLITHGTNIKLCTTMFIICNNFECSSTTTNVLIHSSCPTSGELSSGQTGF